MRPLTLDTADLLGSVTLRITVRHRPATRARVWLGGLLMRMGARVWGVPVHIDIAA